MGTMNLLSMLDTGLDTDLVLQWHLASNLYPPLAGAFDDAKVAIEAVAMGDENKVVWTEPDGSPAMYAFALVGMLHLEPFVEAVLDAE